MRVRRLLPWLVCAGLTACSNPATTCKAPCDASPPPPAPLDLSVPDLTAAADLAIPRATPDLTLAAPPDLGGCCDLANPAGPWPTAPQTLYGAANGLTGELIDSSADDAQNIWAVTPDALLVLRPGQTQFLRFTAADGLHIQPFLDPAGNQAVTHITTVAGGRANEAFVGYYGYESDNRLTDTVANEQLGQADKITLASDGKIQVLRYNFRCDFGSSWCWENRSARRMMFVHTGAAAGHLFIGFDHGVTHVFNDHFGDHVHVEAIYHATQPGQYEGLKIGEQYGLAILPSGDLLTGSGYGVGVQTWNPDPHAWVSGVFKWAFTTYGPAAPYNNNMAHSLDVYSGYREDNRGAAITPDGTMWLASFDYGLASYNPVTAHGDFSQIKSWTSTPGLPTSKLLDIAADPDGSVWLVSFDGQLLRFDPSANAVKVWPGLADVRRIVVDTTVTPRALYVSLGSGGLAVIRAK